jgi:guanine nucleotide-binding protein G(i) subunit alpha
MRAVLEAMGALHINLGDQGNRVHVKAVLSYAEVGPQNGLSPELAAAIKALWQDAGVQVCSSMLYITPLSSRHTLILGGR